MSSTDNSQWAEWKDWKDEIQSGNLSGDDLFNRLKKKGRANLTYMHYVCWYGKYEDMRTLIPKLSSTQKYHLMRKQSKINKNTPLMKMMHNRDLCKDPNISSYVKLIFSSMTQAEAFEIVAILNRNEENTICLAARTGRLNVANLILSLFDPAHQLILLSSEWRFKTAASDQTFDKHGLSYDPSVKASSAKRRSASPIEVAEKRGFKEVAKTLNAVKAEAQISAVLQSNLESDTDMRKMVDEIVRDTPMTLSQVERLSSSTSQYIIPENQSRCRRCVLLLYNTFHREGAITEAEELEDSFKLLGFETHPIEWTNTFDLQCKINDQLEQLKSQCCMLVVSIMSHGRNGSLIGNDGSTIPVNDILHQITEAIPAQVPMIMIVQACQGFEALSDLPAEYNYDMVNRGNPDEDRRIVLTRPHTVLLLSTASGGSALRGAYTGALARQLQLADGKRDIHDMHLEAVKEVRAIGELQVPMYMCTLLRGRLTLPKSKGGNCRIDSGIGESDKGRSD